LLASRSSIRILRGYYAFNAGADQSKEDNQGNTKKRQKEDRAWMRQQRTLWKEEVFLFDVITVKMPATSS